MSRRVTTQELLKCDKNYAGCQYLNCDNVIIASDNQSKAMYDKDSYIALYENPLKSKFRNSKSLKFRNLSTPLNKTIVKIRL